MKQGNCLTKDLSIALEKALRIKAFWVFGWDYQLFIHESHHML